MKRRYSRSTTTVRPMRAETTVPAKSCPRTLSLPWKGQWRSLHWTPGAGTSIPMSRAVAAFTFFFSAIPSPCLLHAVLGPEEDLVARHLDPRQGEPEPRAPLGDAPVPASPADDEGVLRLVHDGAPEAHRGRVRRGSDLDLQPDVLLFPRAHIIGPRLCSPSLAGRPGPSSGARPGARSSPPSRSRRKPSAS